MIQTGYMARQAGSELEGCKPKPTVKHRIPRVLRKVRQAAPNLGTRQNTIASARKIGDIADSQARQSGEIAHVNTTVSQLEQASQQNAVLIKQSDTADRLREQARRQPLSTDVFNTDARS